MALETNNIAIENSKSVSIQISDQQNIFQISIYFEPTIEPHGREPHVLLLWVAGRGLERVATAVGGWTRLDAARTTRPDATEGRRTTRIGV
ncbi:hypothetical protein SESBI_14086 [Sesbania bispinosa]|nr:hypothetical protein SESBI_14086 [Sesbania bispinosa]